MSNTAIKKNVKGWDKTREIYTTWVSNSVLASFFLKNCTYQGFSVWWITNICNKDNTVNYKWYYNLKHFIIDGKKIKYNQFFFFLAFVLRLIKNYLSELIFNFLLKIISKTRFKKINKKNCFYSNLRALKKFNKYYVDEIYGLAPIKKNKTDNFYLISIIKKFDYLINFRDYEKKFDKMKIPYVLSNEFISAEEITNIYFRTLVFFFKTFFYIKKKKDTFVLNGKNCKNILEPLLLSSFSGNVQLSLIHALSVKNFFKERKSENFMSYVEFNPLSRSIYFFLKKSHSDIKSIAYQHSYCNKNVLPFYHRSSEFTSSYKNEGTKYSPSPDFYFVQGQKNKNLFAKYYKKKIFIIGSLRYDLKNFKKLKKNRSINKVLICPSVGDQEMIIDYLNNLKNKNYQFILSPHPRQRSYTIKIFKKKLSKQINLLLSEKETDQILPFVDLVLCGHSSVAFEAMVKNKLSARVINSINQPGYDTDDGVKLAYINKELNDIFKNNKTGIKNSKIKDYFYKLDQKSYLRFWKVISKL